MPIVGIYDISPDRAQQVADRHGVPRVYGSLDELLSDDQVDVVDIAVPATEQPAIVRRALAADKHVLCQKPFATTSAVAAELAQLAAEAGLVVAVNQQMRFDEGIAAAHKMVLQGWIGEPAAMTMNINVRTNFDQFPRLRDLDQFEIMYHSIHYFDAIRFILGDPIHVFCAAGRRPGQTVRGPTRTVATLTYPDDRVAFVHVNHENNEGDPSATFRIDGSAGALRGTLGLPVNYTMSPLDTLELSSSVLPTDGWVTYPVTRRWIPDAFLGPMASLLEAITTGSVPLTSARDNLNTLTLVEALNQSIESGQAIVTA